MSCMVWARGSTLRLGRGDTLVCAWFKSVANERCSEIIFLRAMEASSSVTGLQLNILRVLILPRT